MKTTSDILEIANISYYSFYIKKGSTIAPDGVAILFTPKTNIIITVFGQIYGLLIDNNVLSMSIQTHLGISFCY